ncbi:hypothetical protein B0A48_00253 [Cryoendolithus antarcticus]|uniref:PPM-type phosphatase domain-containing protein n=1 Tax=Cryoendolithus antarcticus TaxID=1507870 RepID=A0A1V8TUB1_9PEZI|nr:hypothetical protein B0A48_00253 [Cryoendolithus antarcticus]
MSSPTTNQPTKLAGNKRSSISEKGGLLNRMFGSSNGNGNGNGNGKELNTDVPAIDGTGNSENLLSPMANSTASPEAIQESRDEVSNDMRSPVRKSEEASTPTADKKRRSSGVGRARDLFSSAKQSLSNLSGSPESRGSSTPQTPMQKLGKLDPALSVPQGSFNNSAGESNPGPRSTFRVGVTEDKNKKCRRTMEDTHAYLYNFMSTPAPAVTGSSNPSLSNVSTNDSGQSIVETDNGYFAVFDGHAGTFAADWCGKKVHLLLEDVIRKHPNTPIPELLDMTFTSVDQQLEKLPLKNSGCTAVIAVLRWEDRIPNSQSATGSTALAPATVSAAKADGSNSESSQPTAATEAKLKEAATRQRVLYTANVGDARIVLCRNGKALRLSYDHKGSDENEGKRIAGAGGLILNNRVNGVLAVTRALGDAYMKDLVTGHPYTTETVIQPDMDEFLILACDGLWDVCSDQESVDLIRNTQDPQQASKQLVEHALARFSTDNLSCMVIRFDSQRVQQTVNHAVAPIGVEGDPTSKSGGLSEGDAIVREQRKKMEDAGEVPVETIPAEVVQEVKQQEEQTIRADPGPELNLEAVAAAKKH